MSETDPETIARCERIVAAPIERVWAAWTQPDLLARWYCPNPDLALDVRADVRPGGAYRVDMGGSYIATGTYTEVAEPRLLAFTWRWEHEEDTSWVRVELGEVEGGTRVELVHGGFPDAEDARGHAEGWELELDRLAGLLS